MPTDSLSASRSGVLVLGESLIDVVRRDGEVAEYVGGSPANVALGLGALDHPVSLATWFGEDDRGRRIADLCRSGGVRVVPGSDRAPRTPVAIAQIDGAGHASYEFELTWELPPLPRISDAGHLHTGSFAATLEPGGSQVVAALRAAHRDATVSYDPNARPALMGDPEQARRRVEEIVRLADVVKASDEDLDWFYPGEPIARVLERWLELGPSLAVVTRGGDGAAYALAADRALVPVRSTDTVLVDTLGAGDSFMAGLLSGLLDAGLLGGTAARERLAAAGPVDVRSAIGRAVATAGVTVSKPGAYAPGRDELSALGA